MFELTERELELFLEGCAEQFERHQELLAAMTVNLNNIHLPRGKKQKLTDLLPRQSHAKKRRHGTPPPVDVNDDPEVIAARERLMVLPGRPTGEKELRAVAEARLDLQAARVRALADAEDGDAFWDGPEGRMVRELLDEQDDTEDPA